PPPAASTTPGHPATGLPALGMAEPRRRRGPILAALGTAALALTVAGVLLLLNSPSPPPTTAGQGHGSPPAGSRPTHSRAAAVASGPQIPAAFAGTWSGTAMQSAIASPQLQLPNSITLTLAAGSRTAHEENLDCVNTLTLTKVTTTTLTFDEPAVPGTCV